MSSVEFKHDAAYAPHVAVVAPAQLQDDLRGPIVSRRDHCAVVLVVKRGRAKVYQPDIRVLHNSHILLLLTVSRESENGTCVKRRYDKNPGLKTYTITILLCNRILFISPLKYQNTFLSKSQKVSAPRGYTTIEQGSEHYFEEEKN